MNQLRLRNVYSWLNSSDDELKTVLWRGLRHRRRDYFHSTLYKQHKWDGYEDFFIKDSGRFLTGLLPEVLLAMEHFDRPYTVLDERDEVAFAETNIGVDFLQRWKGVSGQDVTLHDYQADYINQVARTRRGIILSPTGSGKTLALVGIIKCLPPRTPTLVITKSVDLTRQIHADLEPWGIEGLGKIFGASKKDFKPGLVTVANVDSVHKIATLLPYFRALVVDEVHLLMSKVPKQVYKRMDQASVRVGLSATPFKFGSTDPCQKYETKGYFGPVVRTQGRILTTRELQDKNILSRSKCVFYPVDYPELPYETYPDAVTMGIAESVHFNQIVARLAKTLTGRTLIIIDRIKQGELLSQFIPGSHFVYGQDTAEARRECIGLLQSSEHCVCIVQQKLISAGINVFIHNFVNAQSGKATHDVIQRMGRGLRKADDKEELRYYDFLFLINQYLLEHSHHRIKVLREEGHEVTVQDEVDF